MTESKIVPWTPPTASEAEYDPTPKYTLPEGDVFLINGKRYVRLKEGDAFVIDESGQVCPVGAKAQK